MIRLYEDNAGGLHLHREGDDRVWVVSASRSVWEDAEALSYGETGDWTCDSYPASGLAEVADHPETQLLITIETLPQGGLAGGSAGRAYMRGGGGA